MAPKRKRKVQNQPEQLTQGGEVNKTKLLKTEDPVVDANLPVLYVEHCRS